MKKPLCCVTDSVPILSDDDDDDDEDHVCDLGWMGNNVPLFLCLWFRSFASNNHQKKTRSSITILSFLL